MTRAELAKEYFSNGYACSQAVALAFKDVLGLSEEQIASLTLGFGGGIGRLRLTCGAVSGMVFVVGGVFSNAEDKENKLKVYEHVRNVCDKFKAETGSLVCAELLAGVGLNAEIGGTPEKRTAEYYKKRPCAEIVYLATDIVDKYIEENK